MQKTKQIHARKKANESRREESQSPSGQSLHHQSGQKGKHLQHGDHRHPQADAEDSRHIADDVDQLVILMFQGIDLFGSPTKADLVQRTWPFNVTDDTHPFKVHFEQS